jgi:hypothetical protein
MYNIDQSLRGGTCVLSKAGLAIGGTPAMARLNDPTGAGYVNFAINGLVYTIVDADDSITLTGDTQADLTTCLYLVCISTAGALTVVQGTPVLTADLAAGNVQLHWPQPTVNTCPVGAIRVATSGATFIPGTTSLAAGTVTDTYYDFFCIPTSPLTS